MPPIRELFFAILVLMIIAYGSIYFVGGYESNNNLQMSNTIAVNYNSITSNTALPGSLFGNLSALYTSTNNSKSNATLAGSSSAGEFGNAVAAVVGFITSIPAIYGSLVNFIAIPFQVLGVPIGFSQVIVNVMRVGIIALAIVSAFFLFPV